MADMNHAATPPVFDNIGRLYARVDEVHRDRMTNAFQRYYRIASAATGELVEAVPKRMDPLSLAQDWMSYWVDAGQRSILYWDALRERGNNWIAHEAAGKPPLLKFAYSTVADARKFSRPVNYALVEIEPPPGVVTDRKRRPFVIIDPRAGHGPGIGGFKDDSQVGVALRAGYPVYFVIFFPEPMPGQTLADVSEAEAEFLRIIARRHPDARRPVVVGNCQGGWASMLLGALEPDLVGPIVINGAPMSYWAGNDGENPMRYAGGILGGLWTALLASDLGAGAFDGAYLVDNFEYLNPANTFFDKYYTLYSKVDTEPPRFLDFERWWGGYFMLDRKEIRWIVENLFIGNKLSSGEAEWSEGRAFDLREIRSPIILFASLGDNITPPQQAFYWVLDLYPTTDELKANGQVIVGLMHKSVGHLGIFVSGAVAKREHARIVDLIEYIETLPPGVYGMQIEETEVDGKAAYDVILNEVRLEDLAQSQKYGRRDEAPFEVVANVSDALARYYEGFVHPAVEAMVNPAAAKALRSLHPQRVQRWAISDLNPSCAGLAELAAMTRANRAKRNDQSVPAALERCAAAMISGSLDLYRDLRDAAVENVFYRTYSAPAFVREKRAELVRAPEEKIDVRSSGLVAEALSHIDEGGRTEAAVRLGLLLMKAGTKRRRLSAMKRTRELVGDEVGLVDMPSELAQGVIRQQSYIVDYEPEKALAALPRLLPNVDDREFLLELIDKLQDKFEANDKQAELIGRIRNLLSKGKLIEIPSALESAPARRGQRQGREARRARHQL